MATQEQLHLGLACRLPFYPIPLNGNPSGLFAVVDEIDYEWAMGFSWHVGISRNKASPKYYARRWARDAGRGYGIWLHKAVLERAVGPAPTPAHHIGDHRDGQSLNCRRRNLRWATDQMNARNLFGLEVRQGALAV